MQNFALSRLAAFIVIGWSLTGLDSVPSLSAQPLHHNSHRTGIKGQVFLTHYCPGPIACPPRPYQATVAVLSADGETPRNINTDISGHFELTLKAGSYILQLLNPSGEPHGDPVEVTVNSKEQTVVILEYNLGLK
jgi:hypothetical protein